MKYPHDKGMTAADDERSVDIASRRGDYQIDSDDITAGASADAGSAPFHCPEA